MIYPLPSSVLENPVKNVQICDIRNISHGSCGFSVCLPCITFALVYILLTSFLVFLEKSNGFVCVCMSRKGTNSEDSRHSVLNASINKISQIFLRTAGFLLPDVMLPDAAGVHQRQKSNV